MQLTRRVLDHRGGAETGRLPGSLTSIATSDAERISYVCGSLAHAVGAVCGLIVAAVALLRISIPLGLLVLLGTPALLGVIHLVGGPLQRRADTEQDRAAHATGIAADLSPASASSSASAPRPPPSPATAVPARNPSTPD